jgi:DNA-binding MarR family transcriptional regulator
MVLPAREPHANADPPSMVAWRSFLRAHAAITKALEAELLARQRLSLATYDVLVQLVEAPRRRLRMTELADAVLLSRSGITRLVERLERDGLVRREPAARDGRGVLAVLTDTGLARLRLASPVHLDGVRRHFVSLLDENELAELGAACEKLAVSPAQKPDL